MARTQSKYYPNDELFRARVTVTNPNGRSWTTNFGPYKGAGTAKGVARAQTEWSRRNGSTVEIIIERAETVWVDTGWREDE